MNLKARIERLESERPNDYKHSPVPEMEPINRAVFNLRRMGLSLADVLETLGEGYAKS